MNGQGQRSSESPATQEVPLEIRQAPSIAIAAEGVGDVLVCPTSQLGGAHQSFSEFQQGYVSSYIQLADTKGAWVFAVASGLIAYMFGRPDIQSAIQFQRWDWLTVLVCATLTLLVLTAGLSFLAIVPRLSRSHDSVVFFGSVANRVSSEEFVREISDMSESDLIGARLRHAYDISRVCANKFRLLAIAFRTGILALCGMAVVMLAF